MKEDIIKLSENASNLINEFEDYIFENNKEKYIVAKGILDKNKETIEMINESIDEIDLENTKTDLENIINSINEAKENLSATPVQEETIINNAIPLVDENVEIEETIDNTIEALDNGFENINIEAEPETVTDNIINDNIDPFNQPLIFEDNTTINSDVEAMDAFLANNDFNVDN